MRFIRAKLGIATSGAPSRHWPVMTTTPPKIYDRYPYSRSRYLCDHSEPPSFVAEGAIAARSLERGMAVWGHALELRFSSGRAVDSELSRNSVCTLVHSEDSEPCRITGDDESQTVIFPNEFDARSLVREREREPWTTLMANCVGDGFVADTQRCFRSISVRAPIAPVPQRSIGCRSMNCPPLRESAQLRPGIRANSHPTRRASRPSKESSQFWFLPA